mgnify:CR=1 FL=1
MIEDDIETLSLRINKLENYAHANRQNIQVLDEKVSDIDDQIFDLNKISELIDKKIKLIHDFLQKT